MMNTSVNGNTHYKDWIIMDCYSGNDVGGGVAFGVNRQTLGAYIMRSAATRTSWAESAELLGTHNYSAYAVTLTTAQTISGAKTFTGNLNIGASGTGGYLNGSATNGGINSIFIGDDVWLGDCNASGILGMKSTGTNTGFYFYNSSGTQTCQLYTDGTHLITNKPLHVALDSDVTPTSSTGSLVIGSLTGLSIGIDANEIMCRNANAASTLYLQNEGGSIVMGANTTINATLTVSSNINNYKLHAGGAINANDVRTTNGIWICNAAITNAPTANHGALFGIASVGAPCQYFMPDNSLYIYKRWYFSSAWNGWQKISAGYADSSGSCTGNAATATRINGNLSALTDANSHNIWVSSGTGADGIPKYVSGIYVVPSTKTIVANVSGTLSGECITAVADGTGLRYGNGDGNGNGTANVVLRSWYGVGFQNGCTAEGTYLAITAGVNCRAGIMYAYGFTNRSSRLIKENIKDLPETLVNKLLMTRPVNFDFKPEYSDLKNQYGLIAEEFEEYFPELVVQPQDENGFKQINYIGIIPILIKIAQMQKKEIDELKTSIKNLKNRSDF